jgi:hypothetical protein
MKNKSIQAHFSFFGREFQIGHQVGDQMQNFKYLNSYEGVNLGYTLKSPQYSPPKCEYRVFFVIN